MEQQTDQVLGGGRCARRRYLQTQLKAQGAGALQERSSGCGAGCWTRPWQTGWTPPRRGWRACFQVRHQKSYPPPKPFPEHQRRTKPEVVRVSWPRVTRDRASWCIRIRDRMQVRAD